MKIKANIDVSPEEVLLNLKPEYLLEYIKKNYPTFYKDNVGKPKLNPTSEQKYFANQWFKKGGEYYVLSYLNKKIHLICVDFKNGLTTRWDDDGMQAHNDTSPGRIHITKSQLDELTVDDDVYGDDIDQFVPIDYKDIPKWL